jgi:hypothetical protein
MNENATLSGALTNHFGLFLPTLLGQASEEQMAWWVPRALNFQIVGGYAQTELGHGSNVRGLRTVATYDPATEVSCAVGGVMVCRAVLCCAVLCCAVLSPLRRVVVRTSSMHRLSCVGAGVCAEHADAAVDEVVDRRPRRGGHARGGVRAARH